MSKTPNARRCKQRQVLHKQKEQNQAKVFKTLPSKARVRRNLAYRHLKAAGLRTFLERPSVCAELNRAREQLVDSKPSFSPFLVQNMIVFFLQAQRCLEEPQTCFLERPPSFFPKFFCPPRSSRHCSLQESVLGGVQKGTASWLSIGCWCLKKSDIIWLSLSSLSKWHHPILKRPGLPGVHFDLGLTLAFQELHAVASRLLEFPSLAVLQLAV